MQKGLIALLFIAHFLVIITSCSPPEKDKAAGQKPIIKEVRDENGILTAKLTIVDKKLHGKVIRYYSNGKIKSESVYSNNKLDGIEKKFYKDGTLYRTREYKEGEMSGYEYRYYRNGQIKTKLEYKDGNPATGLEEYTASGRKLTDYPDLKFKLISERDYKEQLLLLIYLDDDYRNVRFYDGELIEDKYFDGKAIPMSSSYGSAEKRIEPEFSGEIVVSCKAITPYRCSYVTFARIIIDKGRIM